jgi:hypothetical protein
LRLYRERYSKKNYKKYYQFFFLKKNEFTTY